MRNTLVSIALVVVLSACLSPYLKRAANTPDPKPSPAIVAGFVVHFDSASGGQGITDLIQNTGLDEFGKKATEELATVMATYGYTLTYDAARVRALDAIELPSNAGTAALTGQWRHPDASYWTPRMVEGLFVKPSDFVNKIKRDLKENFVFADVTIRDSGMLLKEPYVVVRSVVYDQDSKKLLDVQGIGEGDWSLFVADRGPMNLGRALERALKSVEQTAEQPL